MCAIALAARLVELESGGRERCGEASGRVLGDKSCLHFVRVPSGHPSCFSAPAANLALYGLNMDRRRISLGLWALATVTSLVPGALRPASPRRRVSAALRVSSGDAAPGGSDAIYAGLRARCEELRAAEAAQLTDLADLRHAWVVLFRGDETGDGIHSLSSEGREIVLAFEAGAEAQRFALVLKAQGFYEPTPRRMDVRDLEAFCASDERISLLRVPEGTALVPPEDRVDDVEFSPRGAPTAESTEERAESERSLDEARARLELLFQ